MTRLSPQDAIRQGACERPPTAYRVTLPLLAQGEAVKGSRVRSVWIARQ